MPFFKLYKPQTYNYKPIYYDPVKEARKEREAKYAKNENSEDENSEKQEHTVEFRPTLRRGSFREELDKNNELRKNYSRQSNIRLFIIIVALGLIAYFILR
jgi:hypothetical protein